MHLEKRSVIAGIIHIVIVVSATVILLSLLIGYVAFARFLTYQLIWGALVLMAFYFLVIFATDFCTVIFSPNCQRAGAEKIAPL